ncbi:cyclin-I2 isoform X1 [Equus przewalskii]|uniref:Cyclin-I2 isoform X1 n=2 Tax=Equus przewalskii TaxID=9798 RepID=A0ABM4KG78_EQUPR
MDSGARPPQQPAASEVRSVRRPDDMALCFLLRPPRWNVCLPAATRRSFPEACHPGAAGLPAPSPGGPGQGAAQAPRAAGPAPDAAQGPQPPRPPPPPRPLLFGAEGRPVPCDWGGLLDERRLVTHLKLALGREARLWRAGTPQVPVPAAGPSGSTLIPLLTRARDAAGLHLHPRSGEPHPGARDLLQVRPPHEARGGIRWRLSLSGCLSGRDLRRLPGSRVAAPEA